MGIQPHLASGASADIHALQLEQYLIANDLSLPSTSEATNAEIVERMPLEHLERKVLDVIKKPRKHVGV